MASSLSPFHLAVPVHDLAAARAFYGRLFGCPEGRSSEKWVDFDFFGHQLVAHLDASPRPHVQTTNYPVHRAASSAVLAKVRLAAQESTSSDRYLMALPIFTYLGPPPTRRRRRNVSGCSPSSRAASLVSK